MSWFVPQVGLHTMIGRSSSGLNLKSIYLFFKRLSIHYPNHSVSYTVFLQWTKPSEYHFQPSPRRADKTNSQVPHESQPSTLRNDMPPERKKRQGSRAIQACNACRSKKYKCDGRIPCNNCRSQSLIKDRLTSSLTSIWLRTRKGMHLPERSGGEP